MFGEGFVLFFKIAMGMQKKIQYIYKYVYTCLHSPNYTISIYRNRKTLKDF